MKIEDSICETASEVGVKRVRVSSSVGGLERERRDSIAGAPAIMKPAEKVRRVRARAMGARMRRGRFGGGVGSELED